MEFLPVIFVFTLIQANTLAQSRYEPFAEKPGSCAPALPVQICTQSCFSDSQCLGAGKCCPTSCGGYVCSKPVTMRQPNSKEKAGSCPAKPKGRWVCSPTCSVDSDCRGTMKCCKNRCGALACQKPDVEIVESVEIPVVPLPEDPYTQPRQPDNEPRNPYNEIRNPYNIPRNSFPGYFNIPNIFPYNYYNN